jgi:hypothetical protein
MGIVGPFGAVVSSSPEMKTLLESDALSDDVDANEIVIVLLLFFFFEVHE